MKVNLKRFDLGGAEVSHRSFNPTWTGGEGIGHLLYSEGCTYELQTS